MSNNGPAGEVLTYANRTPFDPPGMNPGTVNAPGPATQQQRSGVAQADKVDPTREFRREEQSWRPCAVYCGNISKAGGDASNQTEIGLGMPPMAGARLRGVGIRVRSTHSLDGTNYWTAEVWRIDEVSTRELIATYKTDSQDFVAQFRNPLFAQDGGILFPPRHEATVRFVPTGSPSTLVQVTLYADWFVGIGG